MNCIFCHKDSSTSKSVEHIIPESLGNKLHILPKGYVCDECNNYFARKIEKVLLEELYFVSVRFRNEILTKKNKHVKQLMIFPDAMKAAEVVFQRTEDGLICSFKDDELFQAIVNGKCSQMITPYLPDLEYPNGNMSRFLAKCAYEYLLYIIKEDYKADFTESFLTDAQLDPIRLYARYGIGEWQYCQRRIYDEGSLFIDTECTTPHERLYEMTLFFRDLVDYGEDNYASEIYFAAIIFGVEYVICISDPDITGYDLWLTENNNKSPLFRDDEKLLDAGLADVNRLLIKKTDANKIHQ